MRASLGKLEDVFSGGWAFVKRFNGYDVLSGNACSIYCTVYAYNREDGCPQ